MPIDADGYYRRAPRRKRANGARAPARAAHDDAGGYAHDDDDDLVPDSPPRSARLIDFDDDGDPDDDEHIQNPYEAALAPLKFSHESEEDAEPARSRRATRHLEAPSPHGVGSASGSNTGVDDPDFIPSRSAPRTSGRRSGPSRSASIIARRAARAQASEASPVAAASPAARPGQLTPSDRELKSPLTRLSQPSPPVAAARSAPRTSRQRKWEPYPEDESEELPQEDYPPTDDETQEPRTDTRPSNRAGRRPLPLRADDDLYGEEPQKFGSAKAALRSLPPHTGDESVPESISRADATGVPAYEEDSDHTDPGARTADTWSSVEASRPADGPSPRAVPEPVRSNGAASSAARSRGKPVSPAAPVKVVSDLVVDDDEDAAEDETEDEEFDDAPLTPQQRHYLVRALVALQLGHEVGELEKLGTLTVYGPPFAALRPPVGKVGKDLINEFTKDLPVVPAADDPYATDGLIAGKRADDAVVRRTERITQPVILRHLFHTHIRTFPGLDTAPSKFWQLRVQVLLDELAARNLSTSLERSELTQRRVWALAMVDGLGKFFSRGIGVRGEGELRGPGPGIKGTEEWGVGKQWGKGTVKRGLDKPVTLSPALLDEIDALFAPGTKSNISGDPALEDAVDAQWRLAGERARQETQDAMALKETLIEQEDGLEKLWDLFLAASRVTELPPRLQRAWAHFRQIVANALYELLVLSPEADHLVKKLKSAHALFPYWGAKQLLRYNHHPPHVMVQSLLSLLLARPTGSERTEGDKSQSLLQRIFGFLLTRELDQVKDTLVKPLRSSLGQAGQGSLANRLIDYVTYADRVERASIERKTLETGDDVVTTILLDSPELGHGPDEDEAHKLLKPVDADKLLAMQRAFALSPWRGHIDAAYPPEASRYDEAVVEEAEEAFQDALPPTGADADDEDQWALTEEEEDMAYDFAQLKLLLRETHRVRDREELLDVVNGPLLPTMVKDLLEYVFYDGLRAATSAKVDLSRALGDAKEFIDDLLAVRQNSVAHPDECGPAEWVSLLTRHEDHILGFMHDLAPVAEPLLEWVQLGTDYLALSTSDPIHPADRKQPDIEVNVDDLLADERIKPEDRRRILREVDQLADWSMWQKVRQELEARRELLFAVAPESDEAERSSGTGKGKGRAYTPDEATAGGLGVDNLPPDTAFIKAASDVDRLLYRLMRKWGVSVDDGLCRTEARGTETQTYPALWFDDLDPTGQQIMAEERVKQLRYVPLRTDAPPPNMLHTRRLLPVFRQQIATALPDWTVPRTVPDDPPRKAKDNRSHTSDPGRSRPRPASDSGGPGPRDRLGRGERSMSFQSDRVPGRDGRPGGYSRPPGPRSDDGYGTRSRAPANAFPSPDRHSFAHLPPRDRDHGRDAAPPKKKWGDLASTLARGLSLSRSASGHDRDRDRDLESVSARPGPRDRFPSDQGRSPRQGAGRPLPYNSFRDTRFPDSEARPSPGYPADPRRVPGGGQDSFFPDMGPPRRGLGPPPAPRRDARSSPYSDPRSLSRTGSAGPPGLTGPPGPRPVGAGWERGPPPGSLSGPPPGRGPARAPRAWDEPDRSPWARERDLGNGDRRYSPRDVPLDVYPRRTEQDWGDLPSPAEAQPRKGLKISSFFRY